MLVRTDPFRELDRLTKPRKISVSAREACRTQPIDA
jgi:hypothetical protein